MTKAYQQMSVGDAFYTAARKYPGSVEALATRLGKSAKVLRSKLTPDDETHVLTLEEALQIIELLDRTVPTAADLAIKALAFRIGRVVHRHAGVDSQATSLESQALTATAAIGLLAADLTIGQARAKSGALAKRDIDAIRADIATAIDTLLIMADSLDSHAVA